MDLESDGRKYQTRRREREREREGERERERERAIYNGFSHKTGVVQSPCTSKRFHYNLNRFQMLKDSSKCSSTLARAFQMFNHNWKRLPLLKQQTGDL